MAVIADSAVESPAAVGAPVTAYPHQRRWRLAANGVWNVLLIVLNIILLLSVAAIQGGLGEFRFGSILALQMLPLALVVPPLTLLMASGELDLSSGALIALAGPITVKMMAGGMPLALAVMFCLVIGLVVGVIHGTLVGVARLNGALVTLGTAVLLEGVGLTLLGGQGGAPLPGGVEAGGLAAVGWIAAALITAACILLYHLTPFGRRPQRGDPPEAWPRRALYVGLPYVLTGVMAGLAGVVVLSQLRFAMPGTGPLMQSRVLSAALIGGTPLGMGVANGFGGLLGALAVALLNMIQNFTQPDGGVPAVWVNGLIFVIALIVVHIYHWGAGMLYRRRQAASPPAG